MSDLLSSTRPHLGHFVLILAPYRTARIELFRNRTLAAVSAWSDSRRRWISPDPAWAW